MPFKGSGRASWPALEYGMAEPAIMLAPEHSESVEGRLPDWMWKMFRLWKTMQRSCSTSRIKRSKNFSMVGEL